MKVGLGVDDLAGLVVGPVLAGVDEVERDFAGAGFLDRARLEDVLGAFEELDGHAGELLLEGVDELLGDRLIVLVPPGDFAFLLGRVVQRGDGRMVLGHRLARLGDRRRRRADDRGSRGRGGGGGGVASAPVPSGRAAP